MKSNGEESTTSHGEESDGPSPTTEQGPSPGLDGIPVRCAYYDSALTRI
jgi:phosphatidylserine synthase 2